MPSDNDQRGGNTEEGTAGYGQRWPVGLIVPLQDPTPFSPFPPDGWRDALKRLANEGHTVVELAITDPRGVDRDEVERTLEMSRLRLASLTTGQAAAKEGLSLSSSDRSVRAAAVERIVDHMRLARSHDAVVIVGSLRGADGSVDLLVDSLQRCARSIPEVKLALEPLNRYESRLVNTVGEALEILERVGEANVGILLDTFHANIEERAIDEAFRTAGERLFHVHLADSNRWPPGYGHLNFREIWAILERVGYRGNLILESLLKPEPEEVLRIAESLREELQRWWESKG